MALKSFIFVIDDEVNPQLVTQFMRDTAEITQWWHHLPSAYIVTTTLDSKAFSLFIHKIAGDGSFLIMPVDLTEYAGFLPKSAWTWIKRRKNEAVGQVAEPQET